MRVTRYTAVWLVLVIVSVLLSGCSMTRERKYEADRQKVERRTPSFDPAYFKQAEEKHVALFFDVNDGRLVLSDKSVQVRPARMPYRSATTGNVTVVYKDTEGKQLGTYAISDPVIARSCDVDSNRAGGAQRLARGTVEVLLPYDARIATVEIGPTGGRSISFNVASRIKAGLKQPR